MQNLNTVVGMFGHGRLRDSRPISKVSKVQNARSIKYRARAGARVELLYYLSAEKSPLGWRSLWQYFTPLSAPPTRVGTLILGSRFGNSLQQSSDTMDHRSAGNHLYVYPSHFCSRWSWIWHFINLTKCGDDKCGREVSSCYTTSHPSIFRMYSSCTITVQLAQPLHPHRCCRRDGR